MKCKRIEEVAVDYLSGAMLPGAAAELETHLSECATCREAMATAREMWQRLGQIPAEAPSPALRERVDAIIEAYRQGLAEQAPARATRSPWSSWWQAWTQWHPAWRLAAQTAAVACAFVAGSIWQPKSIAQLHPNQAVAELSREVDNLRQLVTLTLLQQPSATERLEGVSYSHNVPAQNEKVLAALLQALESDPNVNVRIAAVDALRQYSSSSLARQGMVKSLAQESSPLVQSELIELLVQWQEKGSIPVLQKIKQNQNSDPTIVRQAEEGLRRLI